MVEGEGEISQEDLSKGQSDPADKYADEEPSHIDKFSQVTDKVLNVISKPFGGIEWTDELRSKGKEAERLEYSTNDIKDMIHGIKKWPWEEEGGGYSDMEDSSAVKEESKIEGHKGIPSMILEGQETISDDEISQLLGSVDELLSKLPENDVRARVWRARAVQTVEGLPDKVGGRQAFEDLMVELESKVNKALGSSEV